MKEEKKFSIAKEGAPIIIPVLFLALVLNILGYKTGSYFFSLLGILIVLFFRAPGRVISKDEHIIVSPADGKVIAVEDDTEDLFMHEKTRRISIFLSIFNVHINRIPMAGEVKYFDYKKGQFVIAYHEKAYLLNEQNIIGIENKKIKYLFRQITGLIARRVVFNGRVGDFFETGEKFGLMKFGSRMDVYLPRTVKILVKKGDIVKGGITVIGEVS
ncbi:phosphatidylserine decarboxylase family protein [Candidatus Desantisbacteria bacterium]|nr:phosphatidylserine decarboxylase family protein [Candidatus Desantisbacteria bacterium]